MTTTAYLVSISALWCGAGAAAAWKLTALHYRSRLSEATASEARYKALWERDSGKMLIAQAGLDFIHQQHVDAGRKAHAPFRALRAETTEKLMQCVADRQANNSFLRGLSSRDDGESGREPPDMPTGRGAVNSRRRPSGPRPGIRPANSAGETARSIHPADFPPSTKGA